MRLRALKAEGRRVLEEAAIEDVSSEAVIYARLATGYSPIEQIIHSEDEVDEEQARIFFECIEKRKSAIPSAYITGEKEFYGRIFKVTPSVLIPRPDTETLAEEGVKFMKNRKGTILDLCTGSGCVGITVAAETGCQAVLSDISQEALQVAAENAGKLIHGRAGVVLSDLFAAFDGLRFAAILSNPPYLTDIWYEETADEVKAEPQLAFPGGGADGLDIIRKIIREAPAFLENKGLLAIECDFRQCDECVNVMQSSGFSDIWVVKDLSGRGRVVRGVINA